MKTYILANTRDSMTTEIQTKIMLDGYPLEAKTARTVAGLYRLLENDDATPIILGPQIIQEGDFSIARLTGHKVYGYLSKTEDAKLFLDLNIPCIGIAKDSDALIEMLLQDTLPIMRTGAFRPKEEAQDEEYVDVDAIEAQEAKREATAQATPAPEPKPQSQPQATMNMPFTQEQMAKMFMGFMQQMGMQQAAQQPVPEPVPEPKPQAGEKPRHEEKRKSRSEAARPADYAIPKRDGGDDAVTKALERDGIFLDEKRHKEKASVVTVYAAKGGVGKTTIATELAAYLALTYSGRNRLSVCVVDYNIDFGDVCSHLGLNPKGNNMISWAAEIDAMIADGENPDNIHYSAADIRKGYLQRMDKTDLYALLAPIAHEDSMDISAVALKVMLRNIIEHGGFDYVVIDTGNNTRDAAIVALEAADHILLIATQDLTTANCNSSVLDVLGKMQNKRPGLNTGKISLIINNVIPAGEAGVSTQDVEEAFDLQCIAKIKRTPDVLKANNFSRPLIYDAKHPFTHQIQKIVKYITMGEFDPVDAAEPERKPRGLARLFKR